MATQLYAKKWLIYASYTLQPKKIRANCGLAVNPYVTGSSPVARAKDSAELKDTPRFLFLAFATYLLPKTGVFDHQILLTHRYTTH